MRAGIAFMMTSPQSTMKKCTESWYTMKTIHGTALCCTTEKIYQQTGVMRNVHALMQNDAVWMMLWATTHKVMVYNTMTLTMAVLE